MTDANHKKAIRKQRSIGATDDEWNAVREGANKLGISISTFIIDVALKNLVSKEEQPTLSIDKLLATQIEILREVLILTTVTKDNMDSRDDGARFDAIAKKVSAKIDAHFNSF